MKRYTFYINVDGIGSNPKAAWEDAMEQLTDALFQGEYNAPPADIFGPDDSVPATEILGGSLDAGFGIEHGEEEF